MDKTPLSKTSEESLEERLDRINIALQNTMQEMDVSSHHLRNQSLISYIHSYTNSYCNFDTLEIDHDVEKSEENIEENIEELLVSLDRAQMQVEDFWGENMRKLPAPIDEETERYIVKLEKENKRLRNLDGRQGISKVDMKKNLKLEQERKNFEERLSELDFLVSTYKTKHTQITVLEENLRTKESLLDQKEKQLRETKAQLDKSKKIWEQSVVNRTVNAEIYQSCKNVSVELGIEEAPPPNLAMTPNRASELQGLQQSLRLHELKFKNIEDPDEKSRLVTVIDQIKNKIAALRGQQVMMLCNRSSKIMTDMKKTIEKEVNYEEYLRKSNLERFSVKGSNRNTPKASMTPSYGSLGSKRFLFSDE
jgi:hypothetical protein